MTESHDNSIRAWCVKVVVMQQLIKEQENSNSCCNVGAVYIIHIDI